MVTIGTTLVFLLLFILITFIDSVVYGVSFITALHFLFDVPVGLGRSLLYLSTIVGFLVAFLNDFRRKKVMKQ